MNIDLLHEFVIISSSSSMRDAAARCGISPSCLSKHLHQLEADVGFKLVTRTAHQLNLTEIGTIFLPYARQYIAILTALNDEFSSSPKTESTQLTIGISPFVFHESLILMLQEFCDLHPFVRLHIIEDLPDALRDKILRGECDIALACLFQEPCPDSRMVYNLCRKNDALLVLPAYHPLANRKSISFSELSHERFLMLNANNLMKKRIINYCRIEGFSPNIVYEGLNIDHLIKMVRTGFGIALLPHRIGSRSTSSLSFVPVFPSIPSYTELLYLRNNHNPIVKELIPIFMNYFKSF